MKTMGTEANRLHDVAQKRLATLEEEFTTV
jgi:hypothetical protein